MITGLGIGLIGFGLILAYAGLTGQHVKEELGAVFTGGAGPRGTVMQYVNPKTGAVIPPAGIDPAAVLAATGPAPATPAGGTNPLPTGKR